MIAVWTYASYLRLRARGYKTPSIAALFGYPNPWGFGAVLRTKRERWERIQKMKATPVGKTGKEKCTLERYDYLVKLGVHHDTIAASYGYKNGNSLRGSMLGMRKRKTLYTLAGTQKDTRTV